MQFLGELSCQIILHYAKLLILLDQSEGSAKKNLQPIKETKKLIKISVVSSLVT
jgi:hypothetical protein